MKVLVAGKGGTGKTTIAATLAYILSESGYKVLVLDTDSVPNTAVTLGVPIEEAVEITPLTMNERLVEERTGAKPGEGWGLFFALNPKVDDIAEKYGIRLSENLGLVVVGSIDASKQGCLCPAIALARQFLRHMLTAKEEIVLVDSEAGAEVFGRGLAEYFDLMFCISEPTLKSLDISIKLVKMAEELSIKQNVILVNKVRDEDLAKRLCNKILGEKYRWHLIHYDENVERVDYEGKPIRDIPRESIIFKDLKAVIRSETPWIRVR